MKTEAFKVGNISWIHPRRKGEEVRGTHCRIRASQSPFWIGRFFYQYQLSPRRFWRPLAWCAKDCSRDQTHMWHSTKRLHSVLWQRGSSGERLALVEIRNTGPKQTSWVQIQLYRYPLAKKWSTFLNFSSKLKKSYVANKRWRIKAQASIWDEWKKST